MKNLLMLIILFLCAETSFGQYRIVRKPIEDSLVKVDTLLHTYQIKREKYRDSFLKSWPRKDYYIRQVDHWDSLFEKRYQLIRPKK